MKVIKSEKLSTPYGTRYVIINEETNEVIDDAQGYGYKTAQKAHLAYAYKTRDKSKDKAKQLKRKKIQKFIKDNYKIMEDIDDDIFHYYKDEPDYKFTYKDFKGLVEYYLKEYNLELEGFTIFELYKEYIR